MIALLAVSPVGKQVRRRYSAWKNPSKDTTYVTLVNRSNGYTYTTLATIESLMEVGISRNEASALCSSLFSPNPISPKGYSLVIEDKRLPLPSSPEEGSDKLQVINSVTDQRYVVESTVEGLISTGITEREALNYLYSPPREEPLLPDGYHIYRVL